MSSFHSGSADQVVSIYESPQARGVGGGLNLTGLAALYVLTLRQHMHGKRWMIMALLFLLPAALALVVRMTASEMLPIQVEFLFVFLVLPHAILPLVALIYASGIIQDEQEDQTITYLLIRPIPKWALYAAKLLATVTTTVVLTAAFTAVTYAVIYFGTEAGPETVMVRAAKAIAVHSLAMITYCCLFGLMSLFTRRFLIAGILYIILIEGVFANLPFSVRWLTVIYYARLIAYRMMPFVFTQNGHTIDMASDAWQLDAEKNPMLAGHPTTDTCLIVLLGASLAFMVIAAVICSRREFHVKTPTT
jgi:ABC-2 type transport system permease protein